jgi:hypothetical protein
MNLVSAVCRPAGHTKMYNFPSVNDCDCVLLLGGADYSRLLPSGSYVDALSQSPANLAHFIKYLDANQSLYRAYFQVLFFVTLSL